MASLSNEGQVLFYDSRPSTDFNVIGYTGTWYIQYNGYVLRHHAMYIILASDEDIIYTLYVFCFHWDLKKIHPVIFTSSLNVFT